MDVVCSGSFLFFIVCDPFSLSGDKSISLFFLSVLVSSTTGGVFHRLWFNMLRTIFFRR